MWGLGIKPGASGKASCALNHAAISSVLLLALFTNSIATCSVFCFDINYSIFNTYASQEQVPFFLSIQEFFSVAQLLSCLIVTALNKIDTLIVCIFN